MEPTPFTDLVGCRLPIQQAAMGAVGTVELAVAVADAGALGMLPQLGPEPLERRLDAVGDRLVGIGFFGFLVDATLDDLELAASRSRVVEVFWAAPRPDVVARIHGGGALAGWQVGDVDEARAAVDAGCDLVVVQGVEAGGHVRGTTPLLELLDAVDVDVPVVAAGGISSGAAMAAALERGADAVRIGTRLVATPESAAHPAYVQALLEGTETTLTTAFEVGWPDAPHRVLTSALEALAGGSGDVQPPTKGDDDDVAARALYAGTGVAAIRDAPPAGTVIERMVAEAEAALRSPGGRR